MDDIEQDYIHRAMYDARTEIDAVLSHLAANRDAELETRLSRLAVLATQALIYTRALRAKPQ